MGFLSGNSGSIQFANRDSVGSSGYKSLDTRVTNWTLTSTANLLDTTTLGDYDKSSVYGIRTTTGTLRLFYYNQNNSTEGSPATNSASWFINALSRGISNSNDNALPVTGDPRESIAVRLKLYLNDQGASNDYVELDANLNSISYGSNVGELVAVDVTFEAIGQVLVSRV